MSIDFSQVDKLADDLKHVPDETLPKVRKVVARGAVTVKNQMRDEARSTGHYRHFFRSISYDETDDGLGAVIGPDKAMIQGALGNLLYFGTSRTAGVLDINGPVNREAPRMADAIADVAEDVL